MSGILQAKYLPVENQRQLLTDLVENDDFSGLQSILTAVKMEEDVLNSVCGQVTDKIVELLARFANEIETKHDIPDQLLEKLAAVAALIGESLLQVQDTISEQLSLLANTRRKHVFDEEFLMHNLDQLIGTNSETNDESRISGNENFLVYLNFLVFASMQQCEQRPSATLDRLLVAYLASKDEALALAAQCVCRWRVEQISTNCVLDHDFDHAIWTSVEGILSRPNLRPWIVRNGYMFLLQLLRSGSTSPSLAKLHKTEEFWRWVQNGLRNDSHDIRKFSTSILKLSIKRIDPADTITNSLLHWKPETYEENISLWKRFTTLYEIVAIDTSMNQFEAASQDILGLFKSKTIDSSWGLIIFLTGLKANMESVRRYALRLLFQIENKAVFTSDLKLLKEHFLPAMMQAYLFNVDQGSCHYGENFSAVIKDIVLRSSHDFSRNTLSELLLTILEGLKAQSSGFDPARIYAFYGLHGALKVGKIKILDERHLEIIGELFNTTTEEEIMEITVQTLYLRLLLYTSVKVSDKTWLEALGKHISSKQNYSYFKPLIEDFKDLVVVNFGNSSAEAELSDFVQENAGLQVLSYLLFDFRPTVIDDDFLIELAAAGEGTQDFKDNYIALVSKLIQNFDSIEPNRRLYLLTGLPFFTHETWRSIKLEPMFHSLVDNFDVDKFKFLVSLHAKAVDSTTAPINIDYEEIFGLYESIKSSMDLSQKTFKEMDAAYGAFFTFVDDFLKVYALDTEKNDVQKLIELMWDNSSKDNGRYEGNLAITRICSHLLDVYLTNVRGKTNLRRADELHLINRILALNTDIWELLASERLVLNQRDLHLSLIKTIFHPNVLFAASESSENGNERCQRLRKCAFEIIEQAHSRRGFLPALSVQMDTFMKAYGQELKPSNANLTWLADILFRTFTRNQMAINVFSIVPTIGRLFDDRIDPFRGLALGIYRRVYGESESVARIHIINAILNSATDFKRMAFFHLLEKDTNLLCAKKGVDGYEESERLLKWQLLFLTIKSLKSDNFEELVEHSILPSVLQEISPLVRVYMEWFVALGLISLLEEDKSYACEDILFKHMTDHCKPLVTITVIRIVFLALHVSRSKRLLAKFLSHLIPCATSNKPLVRHFGNSLTIPLWETFQHEIKDDILRSILYNLYRNAKQSEVLGQYRLGDARIWNIQKDLTLTNIFGGLLLKLIDHDVPYIDAKAFAKFGTNDDEFPIGVDESDLWLAKRAKSQDVQRNVIQGDSPLQKKTSSWDEVQGADEERTANSIKRSELIVVASLVDKAPNLGGICRLCDVLGVGLLTVHDIKVKNHPQFKTVAVTADRWMPIESVSTTEISDFVKCKKREGYTLIGLEQTDQSVKLDNKFSFPPKSLILLGTEAEGIPGHLLAELDVCVEIKQSGVIRSMNIQTATAVIVHAYSAQHM
ncbi:LAMI_0E02916g1_1 [Lachancea mirantina]|uniref:LAMI_0E02916g1_1 n=1 Tax=Lachancea mirantina TaxID=1230905 RepID=A0A1G4JJE1_9SACH|nr:LAMI_0E02916g1_1 [Lachancea mirantina]